MECTAQNKQFQRYVPISIYEKDDQEFRELLINYYEEVDNNSIQEVNLKKFLFKIQSELGHDFGIEEKMEAKEK